MTELAGTVHEPAYPEDSGKNGYPKPVTPVADAPLGEKPKAEHGGKKRHEGADVDEQVHFLSIRSEASARARSASGRDGMGRCWALHSSNRSRNSGVQRT